MSASAVCSESSLAAGEPLAGTATEAASWLLVEVRGAWGRDAVADTDLPPAVRETLDAFPGKVILVRRPDRRHGVTVIRAIAAESGGHAVRQELDSFEALPGADLDQGEPVDGPLVLVCAHGRRDACCARLGPPLFEALAPHLPPERLWQSLPPRRAPIRAQRARASARDPAGTGSARQRARGRSICSCTVGSRSTSIAAARSTAPAVQAAEIAVRSQAGCDGIGDLRLISHEGDRVTFSTPAGEVTVRVEEQPGPVARRELRRRARADDQLGDIASVGLMSDETASS